MNNANEPNPVPASRSGTPPVESVLPKPQAADAEVAPPTAQSAAIPTAPQTNGPQAKIDEVVKRKPVLQWAVVFGIIVIAVGSFTDAGSKILGAVKSVWHGGKSLLQEKQEHGKSSDCHMSPELLAGKVHDSTVCKRCEVKGFGFRFDNYLGTTCLVELEVLGGTGALTGKLKPSSTIMDPRTIAQYYTFAEDEHVTAVGGLRDFDSFHTITFFTNRRTFGPYGTPDPHDFEWRLPIPSGKRFVGFYGKAEDIIKMIGVVLEKDSESAPPAKP